jgi:hypothetical protein
MNIRILGINGIRSNGERTTDRALALLRVRGFNAVDAQYPVRSLLQARSRARQFSDARLIMDQQCDGDAVVAHSRGCLISLRMMELGARFSTVFWFRPAMNRDMYIPAHGCKRLIIIHHPGDRAIWLGARLPWHDFGDAGRLGLHAGDPDHADFDARCMNIQAPDYLRQEFWRHSDDFLLPNIGRWVRYMEAHFNG